MRTHSQPTNQQLQEFKNQFGLLSNVPNEDFERLLPLFGFKQCRKKEVILSEGQVCRHLFFILEGAVRGFSIHEGKEINVEFYFENDIVADFYSLRHEIPSKMFLIAIEPCKLLAIAKVDYEHVFGDSLPLTSAAGRFFQNKFFKEEAHSTSFKALSPEERYLYVIEHQPHLIQRVPLTYLASYLGVSRETLSRIRSRY